MDAVLRTERLAMRPFRPDDAEAFLALAGSFEVSRMTSDIPHPLSLAQARQWLQPATGEVRLALVESAQVVGGVGYFKRATGAAELGFWLGTANWGRGLATEAVTALVKHGFGPGGLTAMTSSHFHDNPASARVLEKCGFEQAGTGSIFSVARGEEVPAIYFWLSRERAAAVFGLPQAPRRRAGRLSSLIGRLAGPPRTSPEKGPSS
jgi:RimJ/RimL family protein N-acetyltransferase